MLLSELAGETSGSDNIEKSLLYRVVLIVVLNFALCLPRSSVTQTYSGPHLYPLKIARIPIGRRLRRTSRLSWKPTSKLWRDDAV